MKVLSSFFFSNCRFIQLLKKEPPLPPCIIYFLTNSTHCVHRTCGMKATVCRRLLKAAAYRIPPPWNSDDWPPVSTEHWSICKLYKAKGHDFKSVQCSRLKVISSVFHCVHSVSSGQGLSTGTLNNSSRDGESPQGFTDV